MSNIIEKSEDLSIFVKNVLLKYCPYTEDRLVILGGASSPVFDIDIDFYDNETHVRFLFGNNSFRRSIPEQVLIPYIIDFREIKKIINFILSDHEVVSDMSLFNNILELKFAINWSDKNIKGINCSNISLKLNFNNIELSKQYLYLLIQNYHSYLENVESFRRRKKEYIDSIKQSYLDILNKAELLSLLNRMSENELKELLYNLDNDLFIKYSNDTSRQTNEKQLLLNNN